jgi:hypothetical protein
MPTSPRTSLNLKPEYWTQAITADFDTHGLSEGALSMSVECATAPEFGPGHDLVLSDKTKLAGKRISISIIQGELSVDRQQQCELEANSLGGLWYDDDRDWVRGWFYLKPKMYEVLWDQVRIGYKSAVIRLDVSHDDEDHVWPEEHVWRSNPLSITRVAIEFYHQPPREQTAEKQDDRTRRKSWFSRIFT